MESDVDVVIPTFRRPEALAECLASLERQTLAPKSIEVVDDSESDLGLSATRNIGIRRGSGGIIAFLDDDCIASPNWIESIERAMGDPALAAIEGGVTTTDATGDIIPYKPPNRIRWNRFVGANMAIRRSVIEEIGGYDERYYLHREDTDIAWRILGSGGVIAWRPECLIHHPTPLGSTSGGKLAAFPRSEQLLYRCSPTKYVECAASNISVRSVTGSALFQFMKDLRTSHAPGDVPPLTRGESISLWTRAWLLAVKWKIFQTLRIEHSGGD